MQFHYILMSSQRWHIFSLTILYLLSCHWGKRRTEQSIILIPLKSLQMHSRSVMIFCWQLHIKSVAQPVPTPFSIQSIIMKQRYCLVKMKAPKSLKLSPSKPQKMRYSLFCKHPFSTGQASVLFLTLLPSISLLLILGRAQAACGAGVCLLCACSKDKVPADP